MKWYVQERSNGVNVRGTEILAAAGKLATHLGFSVLRTVKGGFGDFKIVTECLTKFFMGRLGMQMKAAWPPFVRS